MIDVAHPAWRPADIVDLQRALDDGLFAERRHVEAKQEIPRPEGAKRRRTTNAETARDLASLAVDGGRLIVGVAEDDSGQPTRLHPVELAGLAERLDAIARSLIDPPLAISYQIVACDDDALHGCLLVDVPPSPLAPHMVDGRYWGRSDKGKQQLGDGEVERLVRRRSHWERDASTLLDAEFGRAPVRRDDAVNGHLFVVAEPVAPRIDALAGLLGADNWHQRVHELLVQRPNSADLKGQGYVPHPRSLGRAARRPEGAAVAVGLRNDRQPDAVDGQPDEGEMLELEVREHGATHVLRPRHRAAKPRGAVAGGGVRGGDSGGCPPRARRL